MSLEALILILITIVLLLVRLMMAIFDIKNERAKEILEALIALFVFLVGIFLALPKRP